MAASSAASNESDSSTAPYVPFRSFISALDYLKQPHPPVLDPSVWHSFSGGLQRQMYAAFKFLGLLDKTGKVGPELQELIDAVDRKTLIAKMLKRAYPAMFEIGLAHATPNQFADALRKYNVAGSTHKKASSFFLQAAKFANVTLSAGIQHLSKPGATGTRKKRSAGQNRNGGEANGIDEIEDEPTPRGSSRTIQLRGGGKATLSFNVDVWSMTPEDQEFVFSMIKRMTEYESSKKAEEI
jgi:hypothetical protein